MKLTKSQQLIQEGLLGRIKHRSKEIQENVPEQQPNLLAMLTAATAQLACDSEADEAIDMLVEAGAFVLAKEIALANLATETTTLRNELTGLREELEMLEHSSKQLSETVAAPIIEHDHIEVADAAESV